MQETKTSRFNRPAYTIFVGHLISDILRLIALISVILRLIAFLDSSCGHKKIRGFSNITQRTFITCIILRNNLGCIGEAEHEPNTSSLLPRLRHYVMACALP